MEITYNNEINLQDYRVLIDSAGWKELSDKQITNSLNGTTFYVCANHNGHAVGIARLITEGSAHGLLFDVIVLPEFGNQGIGRTLVAKVKEYVLSTLSEGEQFLIELLPSAGKRNFYLNCGFKYKPEKMDGMYLWLKK